MLTLFFIALALIGCAGPRMVPPADIASGTVLDAANRSQASGLFVDESFNLGKYKVAHVDRSATHRSNLSAGSYAQSKTQLGYSFALQGGAQEWSGSCDLTQREKNVDLGSFGMGMEKAALECGCESGNQSARLELKSGDMEELAGTLIVANQNWTVKPVKKTDKGSFGVERAGFRIDAPDGPKGAVEVLFPGRVWLTSALAEPDRDPAICLMAGLMLYREPEKPVPH